GSFIVGGLIMVASLVLLLTIGANKVGVIIAMTLWGLAFGVVQLSQINMTLSAAPQQFEAAMSLNTMAYNTCIALGALIGGLFADHVGVSSVVWFGIVLVALAVILPSVTGRGTAPAS
ncbi:MFS transporter, partial [Streptomyces sp. SID8455]|nr:MFS transporter [Streptomyces sp. SID8455]